MPTESQIRQLQLAANEEQLLAEIERLRLEVGRLSRQLVEERTDRAVQAQVHTVLSTLQPRPQCPSPAEPTNDQPTVLPDDQMGDEEVDGRVLPDGRFIPIPSVVGGTSQPVEPGAPRVNGADITDGQLATNGNKGSASSCEFAPGDQSATAFDEFFNAPDPHLDKIRRFLLD